jgi:hypothetical protein
MTLIVAKCRVRSAIGFPDNTRYEIDVNQLRLSCAHLRREPCLSLRIFRAFIVFTAHPVYRRTVTFLMGTLFPMAAICQTAAAGAQQSDAPKSLQNDKRVFWIIPNYRTFPTLANYQSSTFKEKFKIATDDSFDRGLVVLAAAFAGEGQLTNSNSSFGQGVAATAATSAQLTPICSLAIS